jgi:hypothetical protein
MQTSRQTSRQTSSHILREALVGAAVVLCLSLLLAPAGPALTSWAAHPGWLVVLILAARYGNRGLCAGTVFATLAVALASLCAGPGLAPLAARASSMGDLGAALAGVMVAWVADSQQKRTRALVVQMAVLDEHARGAEESIVQLTEAALALRSRADRTENSLAFLHDIAVRMESTRSCDNAEAALELVLARTGARAGLVQIVDAGRLRTLASRGTWSLETLTPPTVPRDRTACAALAYRRPVQAREVAGVQTGDSDMAAPILSRDGQVMGMIALWGVPFAALRAASLSDLNIVACWLARSLSTATSEVIDIDAGAAAPEQRLADAG